MTNVGDFIKYYANVLDREVCSLIIKELNNIIDIKGVVGVLELMVLNVKVFQ